MNFKIRRKIKPSLIDELLHLKQNRPNFNDFSINFLINVSRRYKLMHEILKNQELRKDKESIYIAAGQYISSLVTCWETYFRDTFIYVVEKDSKIKSKIESIIIEKGVSLEELNKAHLNLSDYASKQYNFQDLNDTCKALNFLLSDNKEKITDFLDFSILNDVVFSEPNFLMYWLQEQKDISQELYSILEQGFKVRHKVTHDANYIFKFDPYFINAFEDCMIIFPQLLSIWLAKKFNEKRPVYNVKEKYSRLTNNPNEDEYNFVFSRSDFEGKYEVID